MDLFLYIIFFLFGGIIVYLFFARKQEKIRTINRDSLKQFELEEQEAKKNLQISLEKAKTEADSYYQILLAQANENIAQRKLELESEIKDTENQLIALQTSFENKKVELQMQEYEILQQKEIDLEQKTEEYNNIYKQKVQELEDEFNSKKESLQKEIDNLAFLRASLIEAQIREEEVKKKKDFYRLNISIENQEDIQKLLLLSKECHNPQPLRKLIWSEFYLKPFGELANRILGSKKICGIYKITNLKDQKIYIGQSVDIKTRWSNHIKASLGIDSIAHSKVHDVMAEEGIWNFTFELLEECPRDKLNEREKYYIDFYKSNLYGYNLTKGGS